GGASLKRLHYNHPLPQKCRALVDFFGPLATTRANVPACPWRRRRSPPLPLIRSHNLASSVHSVFVGVAEPTYILNPNGVRNEPGNHASPARLARRRNRGLASPGSGRPGASHCPAWPL